jgi:AraC-like DNA-binding protein
MYGYIIQKPQMIPKIIWACKTKVEQYDWQNRNSANMIEFNICKTPKRTIILMDQPPEIIEGDAFSCIMGNEKWKSYAEDDIPVEIISVAVSFDQFSYTPKELDIEEIADTQSILLPRFQKEMPEQTMTRLENLLYRVIELYKEHSASTEMMCGAIVLRIMFELDQIARQNIKNKRDKYIHYYVDKTESILLRQYAEKLTVKGVAEELSISPNYLSAIFKASTGIGFTDRLLEIRMKKAADLLMRKGLHESKVAPLVGYEELGHFRKRFKQYFGVSIRDFCCINKELTLYHDKPQKI